MHRDVPIQGGTTVGCMDDRRDDEPVEAGEAARPDAGGSEDPPVEAPSVARDDEAIVEGDHRDESIDEGDGSDEAAGGDGSVDRFSRVRRSTAGAMMTGIAIGFQQVFDRPKQDIPFVIKASSDPGDPDSPIDLQFDPDDPTKTVAIIRTTAPHTDTPADEQGPGDGDERDVPRK